MSAIVNRLERFFSHLKVSIRQAEINIGASNGTLSRAIKRNTDIQSKWLVEIVRCYPQLNVRWLLTGEGSMIDTREPQQLDQYDKTNAPIQPGSLIKDLDALLDGLTDEELKQQGDSIRTRLYALVDEYFLTQQQVQVAIKRLKNL